MLKDPKALTLGTDAKVPALNGERARG